MSAASSSRRTNASAPATTSRSVPIARADAREGVHERDLDGRSDGPRDPDQARTAAEGHDLDRVEGVRRRERRPDDGEPAEEQEHARLGQEATGPAQEIDRAVRAGPASRDGRRDEGGRQQERQVDPEQRLGALRVEQEARRPAWTARTRAIRTPGPGRTGHAARARASRASGHRASGRSPTDRRTGSAIRRRRPGSRRPGTGSTRRRWPPARPAAASRATAGSGRRGRPRPGRGRAGCPPGAPSTGRSRSARDRAGGSTPAGTGTRRRAPRSRRDRRRRSAGRRSPIDQVVAGRAPSGSLSISRVVPKRTASDSRAGPSTTSASARVVPSATET